MFQKSRTESGVLAKILARALAGNNGDNPPPPESRTVSINLQQKKREETLSVWRYRFARKENTHSGAICVAFGTI